MLSFVILINLSSQNVVYVASGGTGAGTSWSDPMGDIASAIVAAKESSKDVWVKGGVYNPSAEIVVNAVKIYGGFAGTETNINERSITLENEPWSYTYASVVNGNGSNRVMTADAATSLIDGFTIANGGGASAYQNGMGGGVMIAGNATVQNCIIKNNKSNNNYGGGVSILNGTIRKSLVENNMTAGTTGNRKGGGVFINPGTTSTAIVTDCIVRNNTAYNDAGGGFSVHGTGITNILNSKIYNNTAVLSDGVTFKEGAAVYAASVNENTKLVNNLIYNNKGATVIFAATSTKYYNNSIVNNIGFIYINNATASYYWYNNIIWGNTNVTSAKVGISGQPTNANVFLNNNYMDYCVAYPNRDTGNNILTTSNPPLFALPTAFVGTSSNETEENEINTANFSLTKTSPCIDMGMTIVDVTADIEGNVRPIGTAYDAGAFEFNSLTSAIGTEMNDNYKLITLAGGIQIQGIESVDKVTVYTINGSKIFCRPIVNNTFIPLPKGFYVIQLGKNVNLKTFVK